MLRPPPLRKVLDYPATSSLALLAVVATGASWAHVSMDVLQMDGRAFLGEPWRLATAALLHADVLHIAFDLYWLWVFGTLVEQVWGALRLTGLVLLLAVGSSAIQYALGNPGIGLSGVGYGLFGLLWVLSNRHRRFAGAVDTRTVQLFIVWFGFCVATTILNVYRVANFAHGGGLALGALVGFAVAGPERKRIAAGASAAALTALSLVAAARWRPELDLARDPGQANAYQAYQALEAKRYGEAVALGRMAVAEHPTLGRFRNLSIALARLGRVDEAAQVAEQELAFDPTADMAREDAHYWRMRRGTALAQKDDAAGARASFAAAMRLYDGGAAFADWLLQQPGARRAGPADGGAE